MLMDKEWLTIALAKGRILPPTLELFTAAGINCQELATETRKLIFTFAGQKLRFILGKPTDIPTYVEHGAADLGVVGKDVLLEQEKELYELLDLKLGACRLAVARRVGSGKFTGGFVATKYPRITERYFQQQGKQFELIKLHGSVELAPLLNLAEVIVDLVSTGQTLAEHHLEEVATITQITSRLIANPGSYQVKGERVMALTTILEQVLSQKEV